MQLVLSLNRPFISVFIILSMFLKSRCFAAFPFNELSEVNIGTSPDLFASWLD